jgi:hypothetical protein
MVPVLLALAVLLAGCGGGGGGGATTGSSSKVSVIVGVVSDGPIKNARVTLDLNRNGQYDDGEPFGITDENGWYRIEYILEPGTVYLLVVDGSAALGTSDMTDNAGDGTSLTFTMFMSVTAGGSRTDTPTAGSYRRDITPLAFRGYLIQLDQQTGGIDNVTAQAIINSNAGSVTLFQNFIKNNQGGLRPFALQVAGMIESTNRQQDLAAMKSGLGLGQGTLLDMTDGKTLTELAGSLAYQNNTLAVVGDVVISMPIAAASNADVVLTNMSPGVLTPALTFTVKPSSLAGHATAVTPYVSLLEIPEYGQLRDAGNVVFLGADVTTLDGTGAKTTDQLLSCTVSSSPANSLAGLVYYRFDGTNWVNGGAVTALMNIRTAPFVIVKAAGFIEKTLTITGLSQLNRPTLIVRGYLAADASHTPLTLDALVVDPASDTVTVRIPAGSVISEVIVVDSELARVNTSGASFSTLPVTDTLAGTTVTTTLATPTANVITDQGLHSALRNGSQVQNFAGIGSYLDTKAVYRGIDMFLGLAIDAAVKNIVNENLKRFLDQSAPTFYSGVGSYAGVTIDGPGKRIEVKITGANVATTVTWTFAANRIVRTFRQEVTAGTNMGSVRSSTYTFSNATGNLVNALLSESLTEYSGGVQTLAASYEGAAVFNYNRTTYAGTLASASFYQQLAETNLLSHKTDALNGFLNLASDGTLSFNGYYGFNLVSYGYVTGAVNVAGGTYAKGYDAGSGLYFNNNDLTAANTLFTATSSYTVPVATPAWLQGLWSGTFTDSGDAAHPGSISLIATPVTLPACTWWGQSFDTSRNYGTRVEMTSTTATTVRFYNNASLWGTGTKISDTRIEGTWSSGGFNGTFVLQKTP